jgi:hypothetical protein
VQQVGTMFVVLNLESEVYHTMNATAMRMWDALLAAGTEQDALQVLLDEFDVAPEVLAGDFRAVTQELAQHGFIILETVAP